MLRCVHSHVRIAGFPINGPPYFIANLQLMISPHGVVNVASATDLRYVEVAVWTSQHTRVPVLPATQWVKQRAIKHHLILINADDARIKSMSVACFNA